MLIDVRILHFEITQCLQLHDNSIPLVAGKPTVVRVIPRIDEGGPLDGVDAKLVAMRNGIELPGSPIASSNGPISVGDSGTRSDASASLDFILEPSWCEGDVEFLASLVLPATTADGDPVVDPNKANNYRIHATTFYPGPSLDLRHVTVNHLTSEPGDRVKEQRTCGFLHSIMPMDPLELSYEPASKPELIFDEQIDGRIDDAKLIAKLNQIFIKDAHAKKLYGWTAEGMFPHNGRSDPIYADGGGNVAFGNDTGDDSDPATWRWRRTLAHEIGHNTDAEGLLHPSNFPPSSYFYPHHLQDDQFGYDVLGIDPFNRVVMRTMPNNDDDLYDFMVAGKFEFEAWIGRYNYEYLLAAYGINQLTPVAPAPPAPAPDPLYYIVHGVIRLTGAGELISPDAINPRLVTDKIRQLAARTPRAQGDAEIRFFDTTGEEISELRIGWRPRFEDAEGNPADAWFSWVTAIRDDVRSIELYYSDAKIGGSIATPSPDFNTGLGFDEGPTVVYDPDNSTLEFSWRTADFENGQPDFEIDFQFDGVWTLRELGTQETNDPFELSIPIDEIPDQILVTLQRNLTETAEAVLAGPAETSSPKGRIVSPATSPATYREGEHLLLMGYGIRFGRRDPELTVAWTLINDDTDDETPLGDGEKVVYREVISQGDYTLYLTVEGSRVAEVEIKVIPREEQYTVE